MGVAIAAPWVIFVALNRQTRDRTGQVWQASVDTLRKAMSGEAHDMDELARRVEALKDDKSDQQQDQPK